MATNITEKYEFLTQIHSSYSGLEQRLALRQNPRQLWSFNYTAMQPWQAQYLRAMTNLRQSTLIYIPAWHRGTELTNNIAKNTFHLPVRSEDMFGFRDSAVVFIFQTDKLNQESNNCYSVNRYASNNFIVTNNKLKRDLVMKTDMIFPMLNCYIQPTDNVSYDFSSAWGGTMNYEIFADQNAPFFPQNYDIYHDEIMEYEEEYKLPKYYSNKEVLIFEPAWVSNLSEKIEKNVTKLDNETGRIFYDIKSNIDSSIRGYGFNLIKRQSINNFIRFFYRHKGRFKSFYMPTWLNDITMVKDAKVGDQELIVSLSNLYKFYQDNELRKKLIVITKSRKPIIIDIMKYDYEYFDPKDGIYYGKLLLGNALNDNINLDDIHMISYFIKCRFDSDELVMDYESGEVATTNVSVKEVFD